MIINFISLKGGVGKTTLAVNLAAYLKKEYNKKILLIDVNFNNYSTKLFSKVKLEEYGERLCNGIYPLKYFHLKILKNLPKEIEKDLEILKKYYDYIIFDIPNNLDIILYFNNFSDLNFLILNPDLFSIFSNYYLLQIINKEKTKIILNKYNGDKNVIKLIEKKFRKKVSAIFSFNKELEKLTFSRIPVVYLKNKSKFIKEIDELASLLTGKKKRISLLEKIFSIFL